jgi:hypothetical protein
MTRGDIGKASGVQLGIGRLVLAAEAEMGETAQVCHPTATENPCRSSPPDGMLLGTVLTINLDRARLHA